MMASLAEGTFKLARSAIFAGPEQMRIERLALPQPGPRQVRVRLQGCGICASNLPVWEGRPWFNYPLPPGAPGHEGWGRIDAIGPQVQNLAIGDRVAVLSYQAYGEFDIAQANAVVLLPASLDNQPFPGEALGCAINIFARSDIQSGQSIAIIGIGFLGALLIRLAANNGARVIALSRRPFALEVARTSGAAETVMIDDDGRAAVRQVKAMTQDRGCDRVIEAAGVQATLDLATALTRVRGRLIIAGYHQDGPRQIDMQQWNWRGLDVVNAHERDPAIYLEGIRAAVAAVASGRLDPSPLYTHRFRLDELPMAFAMMRSRPVGFLKALLVL